MTHRLPVYGVQLVRERSLMSQIKMIRSADDAFDVIAQYLDSADREHFVVILLDTKHCVRGIHTVSIGSLDAPIVHRAKS